MRPLSIFAQSLPGFVAAVLLVGCTAPQPQGPVLLAPASMQEALEAAADAWAAKGHARPVLSFAGTPAIARQVEQGAPADIVITADTQWMDWLEERDLVAEHTRSPLVTNQLVVVKSPGVGSAVHFGMGEARIAVADPNSVPAGRYARATLEATGDWAEISERIVPTENVRAALALVERGEAEFGIVYTSDYRASAGVDLHVTLLVLDHVQIVYPIAQLGSSSHPSTAALVGFLTSEEAAEIFRSFSFGSPQ